jgi:hypothetical protein
MSRKRLQLETGPADIEYRNPLPAPTIDSSRLDLGRAAWVFVVTLVRGSVVRSCWRFLPDVFVVFFELAKLLRGRWQLQVTYYGVG